MFRAILVKKLIKDLMNPAKNGEAACRLAQLRDPVGINALIRHAESDPPSLLEVEIFALGTAGDDKAVPALTKKLASPFPNLRRAAAEALVKLGQGAYAEIVSGDRWDFIRLWKGSDETGFFADDTPQGYASVLAAQLDAIGKKQDAYEKKAKQSVVDLLAFPVPTIRVAADTALIRMGIADWAGLVRGDDGDFFRLIDRGHPFVWEQIFSLLKEDRLSAGKKGELYALAAKLLPRYRRTDGAGYLAGFLRDQENACAYGGVRIAVAEALAKMDAALAVEAVIESLNPAKYAFCTGNQIAYEEAGKADNSLAGILNRFPGADCPKLSTDACKEKLIANLLSPVPKVRLVCARRLAALGEPQWEQMAQDDFLPLEKVEQSADPRLLSLLQTRQDKA